MAYCLAECLRDDAGSDRQPFSGEYQIAYILAARRYTGIR